MWGVHGYRVLPWPGLALAPHIRFQPSAGCVAHSRTFYPIDTSTYAAFLSRLPCVRATPRSNIGCTCFRVHASPPSSSPPQCRRDLELIVVCELANCSSYSFSSLPARYFFYNNVYGDGENSRRSIWYNFVARSFFISRFMDTKHFFSISLLIWNLIYKDTYLIRRYINAALNIMICKYFLHPRIYFYYYVFIHFAKSLCCRLFKRIISLRVCPNVEQNFAR